MRGGLTLVECLVAIVASSVLLAGMASLYTTADLESRFAGSQIAGAWLDHNLDRTMSLIATLTSPASRKIVALSGQDILAYERLASLRSTAQNNPIEPDHPYPTLFDVLGGDTINVNPDTFPANWLTGVVVLYRAEASGPRFLTTVLWSAEMTFQQMTSTYGYPAGRRSFFTWPDAELSALASARAFRDYAQTRILGVGVQTLRIAEGAGGLTWSVTR
jgi:prepilin-type N-terminal cleavage/methylation domain-containing protein